MATFTGSLRYAIVLVFIVVLIGCSKREDTLVIPSHRIDANGEIIPGKNADNPLSTEDRLKKKRASGGDSDED